MHFMLEEIKKALNDFASGIGQALAHSINVIRSLLTKEKNQIDSSGKSTTQSGDAISSSNGTTPLNKLFENDITTKKVLQDVESRSQQMQMSGPLAQTQKLISSEKLHKEAKEGETLSSISEKKDTPKPPGFNN